MSRIVMGCALLMGLLVGLLPAGGGDDKLPPPTKAQLQTSTDNLKQIALAIINYADRYQGKLPTDVTSKDGKALLSWRVAILPFIDEVKLYGQFKMDEPWDSENNKKLIGKMPRVYAPVRVKAKEGATFYQVFTGEKALFDPKRPAPRYPASITDGTSNTGLVFEAGEPVIWTKPADLAYDEKKPLPKLGGLFDGEFHVALCDGSVRRFRKDPDEQQPTTEELHHSGWWRGGRFQQARREVGQKTAGEKGGTQLDNTNPSICIIELRLLFPWILCSETIQHGPGHVPILDAMAWSSGTGSSLMPTREFRCVGGGLAVR
jgi:hypothetical protein